MKIEGTGFLSEMTMNNSANFQDVALKKTGGKHGGYCWCHASTNSQIMSLFQIHRLRNSLERALLALQLVQYIHFMPILNQNPKLLGWRHGLLVILL